MEPGPAPGPDPRTGPAVEPDPEPATGPGHEPVTGPVPVTDPATDPDVEPLHRGGFRCLLCQITAANRPSLLSHLAGKRHRRLRELRAERRAQEQRSLFVSGFPRGTEPARLRQHFRAFGDVATVVMDKEKGAFAIVELREPAGRQRALAEPRHLLGGRRLRVRPREHRAFPRPPPRDPPGSAPGPPGLQQALGRAQDVEAQLALLVRALELSAAERRLRALLLALLREALGEFLPGCSLVPYGSSVNGFDVHGCDLDLHLELGGRDPPPEGAPSGDGDPQGQGTPSGDGDAPPNGSLLGSNGSLMGDEEPPPEGSFLGSHLGSGGSLFGDRDPSLEESLLGSEGSHLGSGGSRLGSEGSLLGDRDPSLEGSLLGEEDLCSRGSEGSFLGDRGSHLGSEGSHLGSEGSLFGSEGSLLGDEAAPPAGSLSGSEGSLSGDEGSLSGAESPQPEGSLLGRGAPPEQVLALVGAVLRRCVPGVRGVRAVPSARRPVVKFSHKQSGLAGDVCLDNRLALFNTRFLRLCADADPRVRPLGYAVRLWAGGQRLAGNRAGGGPLLTNYALTLLVVLFLQSRSPPVLPSVRRLRALAGPRDRARVGGWDCSFPRDAAELEPSGNTQSAASLLAEFFSYFGTLDLGGLLLSPLEGRALPRPPPETLGGLRPGPLTLQDPFELSHNVAANVTPRTVSRFVRCCRDAARLCRGPEFLQKSRRGRPWGVMRLLLPGNPGGNPGAKFLIPVPLRPPGGPGWVPHREACAAVGFVLTEVLRCGCEPEGDPGTPGAEGRPLLDPSEPPPGSRCHPEGVTGDSRGEFGVPGTPEEEEEAAMDTERPPAAPKRHAEGTGTGHSQREFGVAEDEGTAGPGSKRRLPEGVPNGAGVPAPKRPRLPAGPSRWSCSVWHRVWRGRRRLRRRLRGLGGTGGHRGAQGLGGPDGPGGAQGPGGAPGLGDAGGPEGLRDPREDQDPRGVQGLGGSGDPGVAQGPGEVQDLGGPGGIQGPGEVQGPGGPGEVQDLGGPGGIQDLGGPGEVQGPGGIQDPGGPGEVQGPGGPGRVQGPGGPGEVQGPGGIQDPGGPGEVQDPGGVQGPGGPEGVQGPGGPGEVQGPGGPGRVQGPGGPGEVQGPGGIQDPGGPEGVQGPGLSPLALERAVTEAIVRGDSGDPPGTPPGAPPEPLLRFQLSARPGGSRRDPELLLRLRPERDPPSPLFQEFFHFLRSFLPEMVRQRLGAGGAGPPGGDFVLPEVFQ